MSLSLSLFLLPGLALHQQPTTISPTPSTPVSGSPSELFARVVDNQKRSEIQLDLYERTQRVERRRTAGDKDPLGAESWRVFPVGTGVGKIALSPDGKPVTAESYRNDLEKLEKYLTWITQDGSSQKEAYARAERKRRERFELLEATHEAFVFSFKGKELRGDRTLLRYDMAPNPSYRPTSRNTVIFTKVRGTIWIDQESSELAKIDGSVTEDFSIGLFLAKVFKGSHFMEERYEVAPGVWEPTFDQYDFDGRKFMMPFSIHERTFYSDYKRVGPPKEALEVVRAELSKMQASMPAK
ncbi:MAG: hypothetical protein WBW49_09050 [Candidatus Acidiferrum sp.]